MAAKRLHLHSVFRCYPAGIAQLVERHVANVKVAGSNPVSRLSSLSLRAHEPELVSPSMIRCARAFRDQHHPLSLEHNGPVAKW
jgi:hypothetical protein